MRIAAFVAGQIGGELRRGPRGGPRCQVASFTGMAMNRRSMPRSVQQRQQLVEVEIQDRQRPEGGQVPVDGDAVRPGVGAEIVVAASRPGSACSMRWLRDQRRKPPPCARLAKYSGGKRTRYSQSRIGSRQAVGMARLIDRHVAGPAGGVAQRGDVGRRTGSRSGRCVPRTGPGGRNGRDRAR